MLEWLFGESKETKEKKQREAEVDRAEEAMHGALTQGGTGLSHDKIELFDRCAHNLVARFAGRRLAEVEAMVAGEWTPRFEQHEGEAGSIAALRSLQDQVIRPALAQVYTRTRQHLQAEGAREFDMYMSGNPDQASLRDGFRQFFLSDISIRVTGTENHQLAVTVYEGFLEPMFPVVEEAPAEAPAPAPEHHHHHHRRHH